MMNRRTRKIVLRIISAAGGFGFLSTPLLVIATAMIILILFASAGGGSTTLTAAMRPAGYQCTTSTTASTDTAITDEPGTDEPGTETAAPATEPTPNPAPAQPAAMPYPLPATHGTTGAEEAVDTAGRVRSTGGAVTWSQHAALGQPYRDFYITMRWNYAAWNFDGTATDIDQAQYRWFAQRPRLVLVTNPRTGDSIIAAAIEAGPGPWVGVTGSANRAKSQGPRFGWTNPTRGTPAGWTGIVSGFPPAALAALQARTGYPGQTGDDLIYQWAPDQNATPGPTGLTASGQPAPGCLPVTTCPTTGSDPTTTGAAAPVATGAATAPTSTTGSASAAPTASCTPGPGSVLINGVTVTIPAAANVPDAAAGATITAPNADVARGIAAGFAVLGLPYVWGGGTAGSGPDEGCSRGGGSKNSCQGIVGFDCSGLTGYVLAQSGHTIPSNSGTQRTGGTDIPRDQALPGDIIGYSGHVAIYLGTINGAEYMLEAPDVGKNVQIRTARWNGADTYLHRYWT